MSQILAWDETNVILNVYDLTPIYNYSYWVGLGIFHSGIEGSLCSCQIPESLQVTTVKQLPEYHEIEDGTESLSTAAPRDSTEIDYTDQETHLLSPKDGNLDIAFVKETQK